MNKNSTKPPEPLREAIELIILTVNRRSLYFRDTIVAVVVICLTALSATVIFRSPRLPAVLSLLSGSVWRCNHKKHPSAEINWAAGRHLPHVISRCAGERTDTTNGYGRDNHRAACSGGSSSAGTVLRAMGKSEDIINGTIRFSCGRSATDAETLFTEEKITAVLNV